MISLMTLFDRQDGQCFYCQCDTWLRERETSREARMRLGLPKGVAGTGRLLVFQTATREHLHRKADGGKNGATNIVMACHFCNVFRGGRTVDEHAIIVAQMVDEGLHPCHRRNGCPGLTPNQMRKQRKRFVPPPEARA